jgi:cytochrome P450
VRGPGARPSRGARQLSATLDLADPDTYADGPPHEALAELRRTAPVYRNACADGSYFWAVLRHADVEAVARQPARFSSERGGVVLEELPPDRLEQMRGMLLAMDPPRHREVRRPVVARLTPKAVARLEDDVRSICREVFAEVDGDTDLVTVAAALPTRVIGQVMGLPPADWDRIHALAERITRGQDPEFATDTASAGQASQEMGGYAYAFAVDRLAADEHPDDLTSVLLAEHDPVQFASLFVQLVTAGQDTTATLIAGGLLALLQWPGELAALRADPALLPSAVEEMLRYANPLHYFRRTATADTELRDVTIRAGDRVVMSYTSANRDEDVFDDAQTFRIRRSPNRHLSFGVAEHFCVGAHLARLEARVFFDELLATYGAVELAGTPRRLRSNLNNALRTLPVRLSRGAIQPIATP